MHLVRLLILALFAMVAAPQPVRADEDPVTREILSLVSGPALSENKLSSANLAAVRRFYTIRMGAPVWWSEPGWLAWWRGHGWRDKAILAQNALAQAGREGLRPGDYAAGLRALPPDNATARQIAEAEVLLTGAVLRYIADITNGRRRPYEIDPQVPIAPGLIDPVETLLEGNQASDMAAWLAGLAPSTPGYRQLRDALAGMHALARTGAWPELPDGPKLEKGQRSPAIPVLRRQLSLLGDLQKEFSGGDVFDAPLEQAVRVFQARHGLDADGVIGGSARRALNLGPVERIKQIELNMERLRWLDDDFGPRYVLVNIAGFELIAVSQNKIVLRSPVVVGREYRRTPIFSDQIINLVLSPSWTPPPRLAKLDILPKVKADPDYLKQHGFRVFDGWRADARELNPDAINWSAVKADNLPYRFRQDPGPNNSLGGVRFTLTNSFAIYLHDSPQKELFSRRSRAFSSGCIRVEKAAALAQFALNGDVNWPPGRLAEAMSGAKTEVVKLATPLPVHITYRTAWVDEVGVLQFRDDIYGRDALLRGALGLDAPA